MRAPLAWQLAWRLLSGRGSRLLNGTARSALLGTALGVLALVIAMALMSGYSEDLQNKLVGENAAVGIYPLVGAEADLDSGELEALRRLPGVRGLVRVAYAQGLLTGPSGAARALDVTLRGVDAGVDHRARPEQLAPGADGVPGAVLGAELARELGVAPGQVVQLTSLALEGRRPQFHFQSLRVTGTFRTGFSEFDRGWLIVDRSLVLRLAGKAASLALWELSLDHPRRAPEVAKAAEKIVGPQLLVRDWQSLNQTLFSALALQKKVLFLALALIVLVSMFNVASTLMVMVRERLPQLGALSALGLAPRSMASVFVLYGLLLGAAGTALGLGVGSAVCWALTRFQLIRLDPDVAAIYFLSSVPFRVEWQDLAAIAGLSLLLTLLACLYPVKKALALDLAEALRAE
ncbi:MAG: FtsX-like permease family protein [Thermoanaerobaculia bacterium]